ncbi:hypothetical protein TSOC_008404 [Tetrabaena socialis]|uniref:Protein TIC 40, chloroplastic n=1 Tax=Tetrabaena socialis TaxID=47790 RepID=A0A2J7ZYI5_9CHLO|nr:hypothetical protein TSOC_008404 [Tetrabaena socialis]|eukprot:PNH05331.1 hypothetical protein TSOC_008404 [Tetrabaena socialis]
MMLKMRTTAPRGLGRPLAPRPASLPRTRCQVTPGTDQQAPAATAVEAAAAPAAVPMAPMPSVPETTAMYAAPPGQPYYQGMPMRQQDYYMPPGYYPPPPAPYKEEAPSSGAPWWIWLGAGVILGQVLAKVQEFMKNPKTPQQMMAEMAMKQMMGTMGNAPGGAPQGGGMPPFGGAGSPFGGAGSPFGGAGAAGAGSPFAQFAASAAAAAAAAPPSPTVDTTASSVPPQFGGASTSSNGGGNGGFESRKGDKFASRLNSEGREARKPEPAAAGAKPLDVVVGAERARVQAAIIDISSNPMNIVKYQTDPEIMKASVLEKVTEIFQPSMGQK